VSEPNKLDKVGLTDDLN